MKNNTLGIKARIKSFKYAFKGLSTFLVTEANAKIHFLAAIVVVALGVLFEISRTDWLWLSLAISIVLIVEVINTAIEALVDMVQPEFDVKAGRIKDMAAGSVLIAAIFACLIGLNVFLKPIIDLTQSYFN